MTTLVGQRRHAAKITQRLSVEFVYTTSKLDCVWDPDMPKRALSAKELARYRAEGDISVASLATELDGKVLVVEV